MNLRKGWKHKFQACWKHIFFVIIEIAVQVTMSLVRKDSVSRNKKMRICVENRISSKFCQNTAFQFIFFVERRCKKHNLDSEKSAFSVIRFFKHVK